jgi:hypothetical protein
VIYGSVCSGIEAATIAWRPLGWTPAWFAEIDPFASALLAHRFPEVRNLGDFTPIRGRWLRRIGAIGIDLLVGGTPCQAFSLAGHRRGLDDPRGNLTLEFLGLVKRLRPRWVVWENVPGVLSIDGGRWLNSGMGLRTAFWTLSSSECPSVVVASSLLDILEGGRLPLRYFLSATACAGILRRAEKRGRRLPELLKHALQRVASIPARTAPQPGI